MGKVALLVCLGWSGDHPPCTASGAEKKTLAFCAPPKTCPYSHLLSKGLLCAPFPPSDATVTGFCLICFAAVAAFHALETLGCGRVAMLDFDVHHGNGVAALVKGEERVR